MSYYLINRYNINNIFNKHPQCVTVLTLNIMQHLAKSKHTIGSYQESYPYSKYSMFHTILFQYFMPYVSQVTGSLYKIYLL